MTIGRGNFPPKHCHSFVLEAKKNKKIATIVYVFIYF
jgi:hypothetical protein